MTDRLTPERRSQNMSRIRSRDTKIEVQLRSALWAGQLRGYRKEPKTVAGRPDVAFVGKRIAVFVDGCFWHGCDKCYVEPKSNKDYWRPKVLINRARDARVTTALRADGWLVLRFWEHQIERDLDGCVSRIRLALNRRRVQESDG